ncbi:hypothetical protein GF343_00325 [Candidatus Woesearchaeota archaeon]|nr:hypothetical protein [Candidatus Woesearchaeota archaeon]
MHKLTSLPRIIGVILLVLSMLAHEYFGSYVVAVVLAGLVLLIFPRKTASSGFIRFLKSFKLINKRFVLIAFYDMLCLSVFFFVVPLFSAWFTKSIASVANVKGLLHMLFLLWIYFFAVTLVLLIAYSVFKGLIWLAILKKQPGARFFKRFFLLNLCWWLILVIPFFIAVFGVKQYYLFYAVVFFAVIYTHLTSVLHYVFTKDLLVGRALKQAFVIGLVRFKEFLVPYSFMVIVYLVLLQVFWLVPKDTKTMLFASLLFTVFFLAWYRLYLSVVLRRIT